MLTRRFFMKILVATLLPIGRSHACGTDELPYSIQRIGSLTPNESLSDFITRYVGHTDWLMDNDNIVDVHMHVSRDERFNPKERQYLIPENIQFVSFSIGMREYQNRYVCAALDILLEKRLSVGDEHQGVIKSNERIYRSKVATYSFPSPGLVSSVSHYKIDFSERGRLICVARYVDTKGNSSHKTLITVSKEMRHICGGSKYELVPTYEDATLSCDRLKYRSKGYQTQSEFDKHTKRLVSECTESIRNISEL